MVSNRDPVCEGGSEGMKTSEYLDRLLANYAGTFDIYPECELGGHRYSAFGQFYSQGDKYVLTKKAKLWTVKEHEYVLFVECGQVTEKLLDQVRDAMENVLEPDFVRRGEKYPEKDHMNSYLTAVFISEKAPTPQVRGLIRKFRFVRNYLFTMRGRAEGRLICVDLEQEGICANPASEALLPLYRKVFSDVRLGRIGFRKAVEQGRARACSGVPTVRPAD